MNRVDKLYSRLIDAEQRFVHLFADELQADSDGGHSVYLVRRRTDNMFHGKRWASPEVEALENTEKEIVRLRTKLKEPLPGPALELISRYAARIENGENYWDGSGRAKARELLRQIRSDTEIN